MRRAVSRRHAAQMRPGGPGTGSEGACSCPCLQGGSSCQQCYLTRYLTQRQRHLTWLDKPSPAKRMSGAERNAKWRAGHLDRHRAYHARLHAKMARGEARGCRVSRFEEQNGTIRDATGCIWAGTRTLPPRTTPVSDPPHSKPTVRGDIWWLGMQGDAIGTQARGGTSARPRAPGVGARSAAGQREISCAPKTADTAKGSIA